MKLDKERREEERNSLRDICSEDESIAVDVVHVVGRESPGKGE